MKSYRKSKTQTFLSMIHHGLEISSISTWSMTGSLRVIIYRAGSLRWLRFTNNVAHISPEWPSFLTTYENHNHDHERNRKSLGNVWVWWKQRLCSFLRVFNSMRAGETPRRHNGTSLTPTPSPLSRRQHPTHPSTTLNHRNNRYQSLFLSHTTITTLFSPSSYHSSFLLHYNTTTCTVLILFLL